MCKIIRGAGWLLQGRHGECGVVSKQAELHAWAYAGVRRVNARPTCINSNSSAGTLGCHTCVSRGAHMPAEWVRRAAAQ